MVDSNPRPLASGIKASCYIQSFSDTCEEDSAQLMGKYEENGFVPTIDVAPLDKKHSKYKK